MASRREASLWRARWRKALRDDQTLDVGAQLAALWIAEDANERQEAWPSQRTVAGYMSLKSERSARRHIDEAVRGGWLTRRHERTESGWPRAVYTLSCPPGIDLFPESEARAVDLIDRKSEAAGLIREHLWLGDVPPTYPDAPKGRWNMARELSTWKLLAAEHGPEQINALLPRLRSLLGMENDRPFTLGLVNGRRGRLREVLHQVAKESSPPGKAQSAVATNGDARPIGAILEGMP